MALPRIALQLGNLTPQVRHLVGPCDCRLRNWLGSGFGSGSFQTTLPFRQLLLSLGLWKCLTASTGADPIATATGLLGKLGQLFLLDSEETPEVALEMVRQLNGVDACPSLHAASRTARELTRVEGFEPPMWDAFANGLRPPTHDADEFEPGAKRGWQYEAASRVERQFRTRLVERMAEHDHSLLRSQSGPTAGMALTASPSSFSTRIDPPLFSVIFVAPSFPSPSLRTSVSLYSFGHHRAAYARAGVRRLGFLIENAASRVSREGGARVATNVLLRDLDLAVPVARVYAVWRSSQMASLCSAACSWWWTPPSLNQSTVGCFGWGGRRSVLRGDHHVRARSEPSVMRRRV